MGSDIQFVHKTFANKLLLIWSQKVGDNFRYWTHYQLWHFEDTIYQFIACENRVLFAFNSDNQRMSASFQLSAVK